MPPETPGTTSEAPIQNPFVKRAKISFGPLAERVGFLLEFSIGRSCFNASILPMRCDDNNGSLSIENGQSVWFCFYCQTPVFILKLKPDRFDFFFRQLAFPHDDFSIF